MMSLKSSGSPASQKNRSHLKTLTLRQFFGILRPEDKKIAVGLATHRIKESIN
jgi:hypothetical protein